MLRAPDCEIIFAVITVTGTGASLSVSFVRDAEETSTLSSCSNERLNKSLSSLAVKNDEFSASNKVLGSVSHFFVLLVFAKFILPLLTLEYVCKYLNSNKKP